MKSDYSRLVKTSDPEAFDPTLAGYSQEVCTLTHEQLGVAEVKTLVAQAHRRPATAERLHVVCRFKSVTVEAQNALLKVLEDTPDSTVITLVTEPECQLLPTVLSRLQVVASTDAESTAAFADFCSLPLAERLQLIEKKLKGKETDWVRALKHELVNAVRHGQLTISPEIEFASRWLLVRGASNKMLLEQLALSLPSATVPLHSKK